MVENLGDGEEVKFLQTSYKINMKGKNTSIINHIPSDNFLFSVLGINNDSFFEAIMEHFFEIKYSYKAWGNFIDFTFEDASNWSSFKGLNTIYLAQNYLDLISSHTTMEKMVNNFLQLGFQILVPVDVCYIDAYNCHGHHKSHELNIVSIEDNNQAFLCKDFFGGVYKAMVISKYEILDAVCNYKDTYNEQWNGQETGLVALKRKERYVYQFQHRFFLNRLYNMMYYKYDFCTPSFGLGIFDAIKETHVNGVGYWRPSTTRRFYQFIADNIELIKYRLLYLNQINSAFRNIDLNLECDRIQKICILQRNKLLK